MSVEAAGRLSPGVAREVSLIINLRSRSGEAAAATAVAELEKNGLKVVHCRHVKSGRALREAARSAVASGARTLVVGGGDGTLSTIGSLFVGRRDLTLALLPVGTGNEVARVLGIPIDLGEACKLVARGHTVDVPMPESNGRYFLHTALMGHPAKVNFTVSPDHKRRFGRVAYVFNFLKSVVEARPFRAQVELVGQGSWEGETTLIAVSNNLLNAPARVLLPVDENMRLSVFVPADSRKATLLRIAFGLWVLRRPVPDVLFSDAADAILVSTDRPQPLDLDGEFAGNTPVEFRLGGYSIRLIAPEPPTAA